MAYDEELALRLQGLLAGEPGLTTKRMFGGLAFLVAGNMAVAASGQGGILVRIDPAEHDDLIAEPHAAPMIMGGRETRGWLRVADAGIDGDDELRAWVMRGLAYARTLAPKEDALRAAGRAEAVRPARAAEPPGPAPARAAAPGPSR